MNGEVGALTEWVELALETGPLLGVTVVEAGPLILDMEKGMARRKLLERETVGRVGVAED